MILYHFTKPENRDAILRNGLIASNAHVENNLTGQKVVWLSDMPSLAFSLQQRKLMLRRGLLCGPRCRNLPEATVCLKVSIAKAEKRLKHFATWLRKHPQPGIDPDDPLIEQRNWFYRGNISPDRLSVFKTVPCGVAYWELPTIREMWLKGAEPVFTPDMEADLLAGRAGPDDYVKANMMLSDGGRS